MAAESTSRPHSHYTYTPSSAASTRQVLDKSPSNPPQAWSSTIPSTSSTGEEVFRPQVFQRRSSNYADADAAARIAHAAQLHGTSTAPTTESTSECQRDATETSPVSASNGAGTGWKPQLGRTQSWNKQDLRRLMQMTTVPNETGAGYSSGTES